VYHHDLYLGLCESFLLIPSWLDLWLTPSTQYLPVAPDALLLINGLKNVAAFGFLYAITPWVFKVGYAECFGEQAAIAVGILLFAIPLSLFGAKMRHRTAQWRIIL
jgi:hypothetical protein